MRIYLRLFLAAFVVTAIICLALVFAPNAGAQEYPEIGLWHYDGDESLLYDGYTVDGHFTPGYITRATWYLPPPKHFTTRALYQVRGLIDETARIRGIDTSDVDGLVSLMSPSALGWTMYVRPVETERWWRVRNTDGVGIAHYYFHAVTLDSGIELSYELAEAMDVIEWINDDGTRYRYVEVCITDAFPDESCPGAPVDFAEWFLDVVRYVGG